MKRSPDWCRAITILTGLAFAPAVSATTGYWGIGYGAKAMGLAGAVVSNPQDSIIASTNPAGMALVGERYDVGIRFFSPQREAKLETSAFGASFDVEDKSRNDLFKIPNFGYTSAINDQLWWGISVYGNGGLNTTYDRNLYDETAGFLGAIAPPPNGPGFPPNQVPEGTTVNDLLDASVPDARFRPVNDVGTLSVDLKQALFVPTLSFKFNDQHTFGASLLLGLQRFQARGLGNFQCFTKSANPVDNPANAATCPAFAAAPSDSLTNNGYDWAYGAGVRIGWIGDVHPRLTLGAAASSKVYMTEFDDYEELFAEDGDFDVPASFTVGATFKATSQLNLSFDFQRVFYEGVNSISNPGPAPGPAGPTLPSGGDWLGTDDGLGFGWEDINVYRLGAEYFSNQQWTWRAGFLYSDQVIPDDQVLFNILAPATVQKHVTFGFTFSPDSNSEWNFAYMHAFKETVESSQTAFGVPGEIEMHQNSVDFSYSYKF